MAIPHGPSPALIVRITVLLVASITDTSFDNPFSVYTFFPSGVIAIPTASAPRGCHDPAAGRVDDRDGIAAPVGDEEAIDVPVKTPRPA